MTIRIGYWDCPSCGTKKNLGPNATCASCGRPRGPNVPFYTDDSAPVVEDPEMVARARAGADWTCKYCSADNKAGNLDCYRCGAGPDGAVRRQQQYSAAAPVAQAAPKKSSSGRALAIVLAIVAFFSLGIWFLFFRSTELSVVVEDKSWVKTVQVEERKVKSQATWQEDVPKDARVLGTEKRSRTKQVEEGTTKVKVGQRDLGNGMFEDVFEEKPAFVAKEVTDLWVRYEIEEWEKGELLESKSTDGNEPPDPARGFAANRNKRLGSATNRAVFTLKGSDGKTYTYEVEAADGSLTRYNKGQSYRATVNTVGGVRSLE